MFDCGKLIQIAPIRVTLSTFFLFVALSVTSVETVSFKLKTVSEKTRNACKTLMSPSLLRPLRRKKNGGGHEFLYCTQNHTWPGCSYNNWFTKFHFTMCSLWEENELKLLNWPTERRKQKNMPSLLRRGLGR